MAPPMGLPNGGGFSSPSTPSPESSFRELDDAFLQNQTRIWLGEVLNMRFDKDMNISDWLADGQILFRAYKIFRRMLLSQDHSSRQKFLKRESISSSEIAEIFPYAKVECFLEVCQMLGLSDIDLFTTSDVVDKRNTRKVCMCLRSLSKKARSRNLNVPDFDSVTHRKKSPVSMPTDMVGNRRRNLESSSNSPVSVGHDERKDPRRMRSQGELVGFHAESTAYKSYASDADDCERNSMVGESVGASTDSLANGTPPRTPDASMVRDFSFVPCKLEELNIGGLDRDENAESECMSVAESVDNTLPSQGLGSGVGDNFQQIAEWSNHNCGNDLPNYSPVHLDWQDGSSSLEEDPGANNVEKTNETTQPSTHSLIEASGTFNACNGTESNVDDSSSHIKLANGENAELPEFSSVGDKGASPGDMVEPDHIPHNLHSDYEVVSVNDMEATGESMRYRQSCDSSMGQIADEKNNSVQSNSLPVAIRSAETMEQGVLNGSSEICDEANSQLLVDAKDRPHIEIVDKEERVESKDENDKVPQNNKPPMKMLKLVAGGAGTVAVVGVLLLWLQLRKNGTENTAAEKPPLSNPTRIAGMQKRSSHEKQEKAGTNKIYPADKLNFGA